MSGQEGVLQVVIFRDGALLGTEVFPPGAYRVGSASGNELRLEHASVDLQHAVLYFKNGKAVIQDSSRGGVFVNGQRVSVSEIRPIDEIRCGPFVLKARILNQAAGDDSSTPPEVEALLRGASSHASKAQTAAPSRPDAAVPQRRKTAATSDHAVGVGAAVARRSPAAPQSSGEGPTAASVVSPSRPAQRAPAAAQAPAAVRSQAPRAEARARNAPPVAARGRATHAPQVARSHHDREAHHADALIARPPAHHPEISRNGAVHLNFELYWGRIRHAACNFGPSKKPILASDSETAQVPLWGFTLPNNEIPIARSHGQGYRIYPPPGARIEWRKPDGRYYQIDDGGLETDETGQFFALANGMEARLLEGAMSLRAFVAPPPRRVRRNPFQGLPWFVLTLIVLLGSGLLYFLIYGPKPPDVAEFAPKHLPPVAVRLITPPKKPEEPKKKEPEPPKEVAQEKQDKPVVKEVRKRPPVRTRAVAKRVPEEKVAPPPEPPPESKALKALAKLSAAGPATGNILAAVDKLGSGPGSRKVKNSNYKLSGLIGKAPIANAGVGTFGLGGGGRGGGATLGAELLRGQGAGGIGALGLRGIGRGTVAGTVTRASARTISAQGSVDREAVARTVNAHLQEVRACYERALIKEPSLAGKVILEWSISLNGSVASAKIKSSTLRNSTVEGCILQDLKTWKFPPAKGGLVIVSYPFLFNSVGY